LHCVIADNRGIGCAPQRKRQGAANDPTRDKQDRGSNAQVQSETISIKRMRHFCRRSIFHNLISFLVLAFFDLSSLRTHFWPFTCSFRKFCAALQRILLNRGSPACARGYGEASADITNGGAQAASLLVSAASRNIE
jgi:hypothetical protein